jgi:hypothetical protein
MLDVTPTPWTSTRHRRPALLIAVLAVALALVVPPAHVEAAPVPVPQTPRSGISFNGPVYAVVMVGDVVYAGGAFTSVTGTNGGHARSRLAAVNLITGAVTSFRADANGVVRALAVSGSALFVGGDFRRVNGVSRGRFAEVDTGSGSLRATRRDANGTVRALSASGDRLYVGGAFTTFGGASRSRAAALVLPGRTVDAGFRPSLNGWVYALSAVPDGSGVVVGGSFTTVNGSSSRRYLASFTHGGALRSTVFALGPNNPVLSLDTNESGSRVFAGVGGDSTGNQAAGFNASTGRTLWSQRADGDVQAVTFHGGNVYFGFHEGFGGSTAVRLLAADASSGALEPGFRPRINSFWGVWAVAATNRGVVAGGEFTSVNGVAAGRLAFFDAARTTAPPVSVPAATITSFSVAGSSTPVVALGPRRYVSSTPTVRLVTSTNAPAVSSVTVVGSRQPDKRSRAGGISVRFRGKCSRGATCAANSASLLLSFGAAADRHRSTALAHPGVFAFLPSVTTSGGAVLDYAGPPVRVRYVRDTRIVRFNAAPEPVRRDGRVRVRGTVSKATSCPTGSRAAGCRKGQPGRWTAVVSRPVRLHFDPTGPGASRLVATVRPDSRGRFVARLVQTVAGTWWAELGPTKVQAGSRSRTDLVRVTR